METTEEKLVAQRVAIREGMWAAQQNGDLIGVSFLSYVPIRSRLGIAADLGGIHRSIMPGFSWMPPPAQIRKHFSKIP